MIRPILDELQKASMKVQFRAMYADIGFPESLIVLAEIITTGELLAEVINEERKNENR